METFLIGLVALIVMLVILYIIGNKLLKEDDIILATLYGGGLFIITITLGYLAYGIGVMIDIFIHTFL